MHSSTFSRDEVNRLYHQEYGAILAKLIRYLNDFDLAEEVLQDAFEIALLHWCENGFPKAPIAWIMQTAKNRAIDRIRREKRYSEICLQIGVTGEIINNDQVLDFDTEEFGDEPLRLLFTCCHPSLDQQKQVALTLKTVAGLKVNEIASAFLQPESTIAQRIARAKRKIKQARIPYQVPTIEKLPERVNSVLQVLYLIFNEGYTATSGKNLIRSELCDEAIRMASALLQLLERLHKPLSAEIENGKLSHCVARSHIMQTKSLLALMLLQDARKAARVNGNSELIPLDEQNRSLWDNEKIQRGTRLINEALNTGHVSSYAVQAAIAALHDQAKQASQTDWRQIAGLYQVLIRINPSPVIELNHAVAVMMCDGAQVAMHLLNSLQTRYSLHNYYLLETTRADFHRRLKQYNKAIQAYERALKLTDNDCARLFIQKRILQLKQSNQEHDIQ